MDQKTFLENFGVMADAPNGIQQLREVVLRLATKGKLLNADYGNEQNIQWDLEDLRLDAARLWGKDYIDDSPKHWSVIPMARLGKWGSGGTPKKGNSAYYGGTIPWLIIGDLNDGLVDSASSMITQKAVDESSATMIPKGAVLIAMYGSIGKAGITTMSCTTNQAIAHCLPDEEVISAKYMLQLVLGLRSQLFTQARGLAQQNISQTVLKHLMVSIPPLLEQEKIVANVDELMALCDELEAEKAKRQTLRTAGRASAIDAISTATTPEELSTAWSRISNNWEVMANDNQGIGALRDLIRKIGLEGWLSSSVHSDESVTSLISHIVGKREELRLLPSDTASDVESLIIPEHWAEVNFGFVHRFTNGFTFPSNAYQETGTGIIRITEIKQQLISTQAMKFVDSKYFTDLDAKFQVNPGDLVIAMSGATTGGIAFNRTDETFLLNQRVGKIEPILINPEFVAMFLVSMKEQFLINAAGSAIPNLSTKQIQEARFALPPVEEQERIVAKVQELMRLCDYLEMNLNLRTELESAFANSSSQLVTV